MSQAISTGYVTVSDNQSTNIDLRGYTNLISARIRWKGKRETINSSQQVQKGGVALSPFVYELTIPSLPSGYTFDRLTLRSIVTNYSTGVLPSMATQVSNGSTINVTEVKLDAAVGSSETAEGSTTTPDSGSVAASFQSGPAGEYLQGYFQASLSYWKYVYSKNPQTTINGSVTSYAGTLGNGEVTAWQTLTGLIAGANNTIRHDVMDAGVDVEIEYTVSLAPNIVTQDATAVSYTVGTINGVVADEGFDTAHAYFEYGETEAFGTVVDIGEVVEGVSFDYEITGIGYETTIYYRAYASNGDGTSYGATKSFTTLYPTLTAPVRELPENTSKITERRPYFTFTLTENANNSATKYHARVRISEYVNMQDATVYESATSQVGWEYWNGSAWLAFPAEGVDPDTKVRFRPPSNMYFATYYWDCASKDATQYGTDSTAWNFRVMISTDGLYLLLVNTVEYNAYSLSVKETANGQIGQIEFQLNNANGATNTAIQYGHTVNLAVRDAYGNSEEYIAKVRTKSAQNYALNVVAITGSGILAERLIKEDYVSQDIGQTIKDIIDEYCDPLTTTNVNIATGISAPVVAKDKTPLAVLEDLRRQYGLMYYIDKDWDMHLYTIEEISNAYVTIKHMEVT